MILYNLSFMLAFSQGIEMSVDQGIVLLIGMLEPIEVFMS